MTFLAGLNIAAIVLHPTKNRYNLLGFGDRFTAEYGRTDGLNLYDFSYTLPLLPRNSTLNLRYKNNDSNIVEKSFQDLGICSESETFFYLSMPYGQGLTHPPAMKLSLRSS